MLNKFCKRLKQLRKEKGLKIKDLEKKFGKTSSTFSKYEKGTQNMSIELLCKFADFYGVSVDYLLGRTEIKNYEEIEKRYGEIIDLINKMEKKNFDKKTLELIQEHLKLIKTHI